MSGRYRPSRSRSASKDDSDISIPARHQKNHSGVRTSPQSAVAATVDVFSIMDDDALALLVVDGDDEDALVVDYDNSSFELFDLIEDRDWEAVVSHVQHFPRDTATWVYRKEARTGELRWRQLPLHTALLFKAPGAVVSELLEANPAGAWSRDDQGALPIHLAFRHGASESAVDALLNAFPEGMRVLDGRGRLPLSLAKIPSRKGDDSTTSYSLRTLLANMFLEKVETSSGTAATTSGASSFSDDDLQKKMENAESALEASRAKAKEDEEKMADLESRLRELGDETTKLQTFTATISEEAAAEIHRLRESVAEYERRAQSSCKEADDQAKETTCVDKKTQQELELLREEVTDVRQSWDVTKKNLQDRVEEVGTLKRQLRTLEREKETVETDLTAAAVAESDLKEQSGVLGTRTERFQKRTESLEESLAETREGLRVQTEANVELRESLDGVNAEVQEACGRAVDQAFVTRQQTEGIIDRVAVVVKRLRETSKKVSNDEKGEGNDSSQSLETVGSLASECDGILSSLEQVVDSLASTKKSDDADENLKDVQDRAADEAETLRKARLVLEEALHVASSRLEIAVTAHDRVISEFTAFRDDADSKLEKLRNEYKEVHSQLVVTKEELQSSSDRVVNTAAGLLTRDQDLAKAVEDRDAALAEKEGQWKFVAANASDSQKIATMTELLSKLSERISATEGLQVHLVEVVKRLRNSYGRKVEEGEEECAVCRECDALLERLKKTKEQLALSAPEEKADRAMFILTEQYAVLEDVRRLTEDELSRNTERQEESRRRIQNVHAGADKLWCVFVEMLTQLQGITKEAFCEVQQLTRDSSGRGSDLRENRSHLPSRLDTTNNELQVSWENHEAVAEDLDLLGSESNVVISLLKEQHGILADMVKQTMEKLECAEREQNALQADFDAHRRATEVHLAGLQEGEQEFQAALEDAVPELDCAEIYEGLHKVRESLARSHETVLNLEFFPDLLADAAARRGLAVRVLTNLTRKVTDYSDVKVAVVEDITNLWEKCSVRTTNLQEDSERLQEVLDNTMKELRSTIGRADEDDVQLSTDEQDVIARIKEAMVDCEGLRTRVTKANITCKAGEKLDIENDLAAQNVNVRDQISFLEGIIRLISENLREARQKNSSLCDELTDQRTATSMLKDNHKEELGKLDTVVQTAVDQASHANTEKTALFKEFEKYKKTKSAEIEKLQGKLEDSVKLLEDAMDKLIAANSEIAECTNETEVVKERKKKYKELHKATEEKLSVMQAEKDAINAEMNIQEKESSEQLRAHEEQRAYMKSLHDAASRNLDVANEECRELKEKLSSLNDMHANAVNDLRKAEESLSRTTKENNNLTDLLEASKQMANNTINSLETEVNDTNMALMKMEQKYKGVAESYKELESTSKTKLMNILEETAKKLQISEDTFRKEKNHHDHFLKRTQEEKTQKEEELNDTKMALMKMEQKYKDVAESYKELESTSTEKQMKLMKILEQTAKKLQSSEDTFRTEKDHYEHFLKRVQEEKTQKEEELNDTKMALMKTEQKYKDVADSYEELESTLTEKKRKLMKILEETAKKLQSSEDKFRTEKEHHDHFLKRVQEERTQKEEELKSYVCELNSTLEYVEKESEKLRAAADAKIDVLHQEIIALHRILGSEYAEQCSDDEASHLSLINLDNLRNDLVLLQQAGKNRRRQAELYISRLNSEAYQARKALGDAEKRANEEMYNSKRIQSEHKELAHGDKIHRDRIQALEANIREIKTDESTKEALQQKIVHLNNKIAKYTEVIGQMKQNSAKLQTAISVLEENLRKEKRARESLETNKEMFKAKMESITKNTSTFTHTQK